MDAANNSKRWTEKQVTQLCYMQDRLNQFLSLDWKRQEWDWGLAIIDEVMELNGHLGWKWWKEGYQKGVTADNFEQVKLEVIDILHFVISEQLELMGYLPQGYITAQLMGELNADEAVVGTPGKYAKNLVGGAGRVYYWSQLARALGLYPEEVMEIYTHKYVLNKFRWEHGYKDGTYVKNWELPHKGLMEDNEVLEMVVKLWKSEGLTYDDKRLYDSLEYWYDERLNK